MHGVDLRKNPIKQNGRKRLIGHIISHIAKIHIFARDFLYGYYFVVICVFYIGQCGGYNIVSLGIVFKRLIISISEAVQRLSQWWDGGFNTDFHGFGWISTLCTALTYIAGLISLK